MILVLTTKSYEQGTAPVVDWLIYNNIPFTVINYEDLYSKTVPFEIDIENNDIIINGISVKKKITAIWYRRFYANEMLIKSDEISAYHLKQLKYEMDSELSSLLKYLRFMFKDKVQIPEKTVFDENKLIYLDFARKAGFLCPNTIVTNSREKLMVFFEKNKEEVVSKPIYFSRYFTKGDSSYSIQTTKYSRKMIESLPEFIFPTLFQQAIISKYEIRVFYINGDIYSTAAVFDGEGKNIDLKLNYKSKNLHWVLYQLPENISKKITKFMESVKLTTGSIDLLQTETGYYFLEVNPVGQYLAPSEYCNYYLEYEISKKISSYE